MRTVVCGNNSDVIVRVSLILGVSKPFIKRKRHIDTMRRYFSPASVVRGVLTGGLLSVIVLLAACGPVTNVRTGTTEEIWEVRRQRLQQLEHWELKGRIGFVSEHESGSASLYWKQDGDVYQLKIVAPLGMGSLVVSGNENGVTLQSSEGELLYADDAQTLIWQRTGWIIPMGSLCYWILGLPVNGEQFQLDQDGRVEHIQNPPWRVDYQRYQRVGEHELPRKLQLNGPGVKIKLLIRDWRILQE